MVLNETDRQIIELKFETEKDIPRELIDVGSSFSLFPQNSDQDVDFVIQQMKWGQDELIGNKTVKEMLINDIDIISEKIKLNKFHSEYDLTFLP